MEEQIKVYTPEDVYNYADDGDIDNLRQALDYGNNPSNWYRDNNGVTALHQAATSNHLNTVEMLLSRGSDINSKDNDGVTALHYAAGNNHLNIAEMLLNRGSNITSKDNKGSTALHIVVINF
jgi:ankyrin repeat protein